MQVSTSFIGGFLLAAIAWLVLCLMVWYAASPYLAIPMSWLAGLVVESVFPVWAEGVELNNTTLTLLSHLELPIAGMESGQVATLVVEVDYRKYGYGLPLLAALLLAGRANRPVLKLLVGALILMPFHLWGISFDWLKQVALGSGGDLYWSTRLSGLQREFIAWGYQVGYLMLPSLIPVMLWVSMDRKFISTLLLEASLHHPGTDR